MSANPHANGGLLRRPLELPDFRSHAVEVTEPGASIHEATRELGRYLVDVVRDNPTTFRIFGPDETASNRLDAVYSVTDKAFAGEILPSDEHLAHSGRVLEILSEHTCQGWAEGYLLTGRHALFSCYEAFIHLVDSMFNQHAKWLKTTRDLAWRPRIASLNYLLSSHVWRQDHNGFSHQDPGFIDHVINKKAEVVRVYLPPDTNTLLSTMRHCLASEHYVNVVVAGQAAVVRLAGRRVRGPALRPRPGHLGLGLQRRRRPGRGDRLRRRHPHPRGAGRGVDPPRARARPADPLRQRGGPDATPGRARAPARAHRAATSTPCSPRTSRSSSPTTATRG